MWIMKSTVREEIPCLQDVAQRLVVISRVRPERYLQVTHSLHLSPDIQ